MVDLNYKPTMEKVVEHFSRCNAINPILIGKITVIKTLIVLTITNLILTLSNPTLKFIKSG